MLNRNLSMAICSVLAAQANEATGTPVDLDLARNAATADAPETEETVAQRKARLEASNASAVKQAKDGTALPDEIVGLAQREIKECWKEFSERGGVWDLTQKVKAKMSNISQHILTIAKQCAVHAYERSIGSPDADYIKLAGAMFRNAMAQAELALRGTLDLAEEDAEAKLDAFLTGSWNVYKSQVNSAMGAGFDPRDHDSIYQLTQAAREAKKAKNGGGEGKGRKENTGSAEGTKADTEATDDDDNTLASYVVNIQYAMGHAAIDLLFRTLGNIDWDKHEDKAVNIINMLTKELAKLALPEPLPSVEEAAASIDSLDSQAQEA